MRQIVLDTETTGIDPKSGHRIIEIGCVELFERRHTGNHFHVYLQPDRVVEEEAVAIHGITNEFLEGKPRFPEVVDDFLAYIKDAELVIHNAAFDIGFLDHELALHNKQLGKTTDYCAGVIDTLKVARDMYPGQRNTLDALCKRLGVDNSKRELHGALLDSEILADVYLLMTGGQTSLVLDAAANEGTVENAIGETHVLQRPQSLRVIKANAEELAAHDAWVKRLQDGGNCRW